MTEKINNLQKPFTVESNIPLHFHFQTFQEMEKYGKNWSFHCRYRFSTNTFYGKFDICQHKLFQLARAYYKDGMMYNGYSPKETITLSLVEIQNASLTANKKILKQTEILIIDDTKKYEIVFNDTVQLNVISLRKEFVNEYCPYLFEMTDEVYEDKNDILKQLFYKILATDTPCTDDRIQFQILQALSSLNLPAQIPINKKLTNKEKILFEIRDYILNNLENNITNNELCSLFHISERSLQNNFKNIFGFTPKRFIKLLRLNQAHKEIKNNDGTISEITTKWGFENFGRFSKEYKQFYDILPSQEKRIKRA